MSNQNPPPQGNPYANPQADAPQGHPQAAPQANPQAGLPSYGGPAQDPTHVYGYGYGYGRMVPTTMPGVVRATQIILWVLGGLVLIGVIGIAATGDPVTAGAATGVNVFLLVACGFSFAFKTAGNGVRVTCIVLMSVQIAFGLGGLASGNPGGILGLAGSVSTVILLSQGAAGAWFKRPRTLN
ncbi:hypothetical protein [Streptomyces sp. NPDC048436]|uniref:hypothetical protein n=1 Tax=Streptomyces sp. NPDC048436 TaxID=3365550 RepID=UPI003715B5E1